MSATRKSIHDADALVLYQVGPVYCCSPALPVESVMMPPKLTQPPGSRGATPGIFKYAGSIVRVVDLRIRFGVDEQDQIHPGRIVVVEVENGHAGMWVDEIIDVIQFPETGWGQVPAHIPRNVFTRTLLYDNKIMLYADFENLDRIHETGYLRQHIELLKKTEEKPAPAVAPGQSIESVSDRALQSSESKNIKATAAPVSEAPKSLAGTREEAYEKPVVTQSKNDKACTSVRGLEKDVGGIHKPVSTTAAVASGKQFEGLVSKKTTESRPAATSMGSARPSTFVSGEKMYPGHASVDSSSNMLSSIKVDMPQATARTQDDGGTSGDNRLMLLGLSIVVITFMILIYYAMIGAPSRDELTSSDSVMNRQWSEPVIEERTQVADHDDSAIDVAEAADLLIENAVTEEKVQYKAEIAHDHNDIVIVLQQPVEEDVFVETEMELASVAVDANITSNTVDEKAADNAGMVESRQSSVEMEQMPEVPDAGQTRRINVTTGKVRQDETTNVSSVTPAVVSSKRVVHVVVKGDTLWHIAKRYIRDPFRYPELARLSKIQNPDLIYPGNRVIIILESR